MTSENTKYMELMSIPSHRIIFKLINWIHTWNQDINSPFKAPVYNI